MGRLTSGGREDAGAVHAQADAAVLQELLLRHAVQQGAVQAAADQAVRILAEARVQAAQPVSQVAAVARSVVGEGLELSELPKESAARGEGDTEVLTWDWLVAEGESWRAGGAIPFTGDAGFHAQVGLELLLGEPQKQVAIYLLLLGEGSDVRKGSPPQPLDPTHKMQGKGTGDGDGGGGWVTPKVVEYRLPHPKSPLAPRACGPQGGAVALSRAPLAAARPWDALLYPEALAVMGEADLL